MAPEPLTLCVCCLKKFTTRNLQRHQKAVRRSEPELDDDDDPPGPSHVADETRASMVPPAHETDATGAMDWTGDFGPSYDDTRAENDTESDDDEATASAKARREWVEDSDAESTAGNDGSEERGTVPGAGGTEEIEDGSDDEMDMGELFDMLLEAEEGLRDMWEDEDEDEGFIGPRRPGDLSKMKMFNILVKSNMSRRVYGWMRWAFHEELHLDSLYKLHRRIAQLASVTEEKIDMCIQSCCAFTGKKCKLPTCPYCNEDHWDARGRPRQTFSYFPLEPRLRDMFANAAMAEKLRYPFSLDFPDSSDDSDDDSDNDDEELHDMHFGSHFQKLRRKYIRIGKVQLNRRYFEDERDIAFGVMTDGFNIFKRQRGGTQTCTPIIAINYNCPPSERTRLENVIPVGFIPGPNGPKDHNSFYYPFVKEAKKLAAGVPAFDASLDETGNPRGPFLMHAFPVSLHGDMVAVKHCTCMKGHNGIRPCRYCEIKACRDESQPRSTYYVPLHAPNLPHAPSTNWDPRQLPMRTTSRIKAQWKLIDNPDVSMTQRKKERQRWGINEKWEMAEQLGSISLVASTPHEWMHLFLENNGKNLATLWTGNFKGLSLGGEGFRIDSDIWEVIGKDTASAAAMVPSSFGRATPDIASERHNFTAEDWSFWLMHLAPYLLRDAFPDPRFYDHFMIFNRILKMTSQLSISRGEIKTIRELCIEYVQGFEEFYYQGKVDYLPMCTLTLHAILHIADDIEKNGPCCYNWSWVMERFCGSLAPAVKSRNRPYAALALRTRHLAELSSIGLRFNLTETFRLDPSHFDELFLSENEHIYPDHPLSILRSPRIKTHLLSEDERKALVNYLAPLLGLPRREVRDRLPVTVESWGKVRIKDGDSMRCGWAEEKLDKCRCASYVQFSTFNGDSQGCRYGRLDFIFRFELLPDVAGLPQLAQPTAFLLAGVTACTVLEGRDATVELVTVGRMEKSFRVMDLNAIGAVVGRVPMSNSRPMRWGIIDRGTSQARTQFVDDFTIGTGAPPPQS